MKKFIIFFTMACMFILSGCSFSDNSPSAVTTASAQTVSHKAPDFKFTLLDGTKTSLAQLQGKPVFLNFWATWCPPCVGEMPHFEKLYPKYKDKINFVAISLDDSKADADAFIQQKSFTFPVGFANNQEIAAKYEIQGIPTSYIIDAQGNVIASYIGAMDEQTLEKFLNKAL